MQSGACVIYVKVQLLSLQANLHVEVRNTCTMQTSVLTAADDLRVLDSKLRACFYQHVYTCSLSIQVKSGLD